MRRMWAASAAALLCLALSGVPVSGATSPTASPTGTSLQGMLGAYPAMPTEPVPDAVGTRLQKALDDMLRLHGGITTESPGGITAAVIAPGCGTWTGASGYRIDEEPMTADTQLLIASITKSVTAAAVLRLAEEGLVDLDAPIADYLPADLHVDTNGATVRDVLRMRSGLAEVDEVWLDARVLAAPDVPIDRAELLATLPPPIAPPDTVSEYRDANYILLGYVIEQASGMSLAPALRSLVLRDAGLERLVIQDEEGPQGPLALGTIDPFLQTTDGLQDGLREAFSGGFLPARSFASAASTAGALVSDAPTLAHWGFLLYGGSVVSDASLALMTHLDPTQAMSFPFPTVYGMGTLDLAAFGSEGIGHAGSWMGYRSVLLTRPESGVTVATLDNDERLSDFTSLAGILAVIAETCPAE